MLWIVEGRPDRSECPRCGSSKPHEKRRTFVQTDDKDHAMEVRTAMVAKQGGHEEIYESLDDVGELATRAESAGIDDETYLAGSGIDPHDVATAGESDDSPTSNEAIVREALTALDQPTQTAIVAYAADRGVPESYTERALEKLTQVGDVSENRGTYRLL